MQRARVVALIVAVGCGPKSAPPPQRVAPAPVATAPDDRPSAAQIANDDKRHTIDTMLLRGAVLVHLDARRPEVVVPAELRSDPDLVLRFGYRLSPAVPDFKVDADAISGTLSFHGTPFHCVVPWLAVTGAIVEGDPEEAGKIFDK
jgi:hypothetical protein